MYDSPTPPPTGDAPPADAPTSPALDALSAAVAAYVESAEPRSEAETAGDLVAIGVLIERLEASRVGLLCDLDSSGAYLADGAVSPAAWLRSRARMGHGAARDRMALGRSLPEMPSTAGAFSRGEISIAHARVLAAAVAPGTDPGAREHFLAAEPSFVDAARVTTPQELRKIVERYVLDLAGDDGVARAEAIHARRRLHAFPTYDGMVAGSFLLDPEGGEILLTALAARLDADRDAPGDPARTPAQRRADALTDMLRASIDAGEPTTTGGERPHVTLVVDLATLAGHNPHSTDHSPHPDDCPTCSPARATGAATGSDPPRSGGSGRRGPRSRAAGEPTRHPSDGRESTSKSRRRRDRSGPEHLEALRTDLPPPELMLRWDPGTVERICELEHLGPISAETARRITCDSGVSRIVVAGSSEPLDVGRRTRTIPPAIRRAVTYRDRHCQYPGCDRPPRYCDVHHCDEWWADRGNTDARRLVLLCRRHHRMTHEGGRRIERDADGRIRVTGPDSGSDSAEPRASVHAALGRSLP